MARDVHTSPVRGMRDLLPAECELRDWAMGRILETYRRFGFQRVETPALEHLPLLTGGDGGENEKLIFKVLKRGDELAGALAALAAATPDARVENALVDAGLRFDLTVPLARFYAEHQAQLPTPFKSIQIGPVFRAERPQKGRFRQFTQCDIDILGEPGVSAEVDLILATTEALSALSKLPALSAPSALDMNKVTVRLNDRGVLDYTLALNGVAPESRGSVLVTLDKADKLDREQLQDELQQLGVAGRAVDRLLSLVGWTRGPQPKAMGPLTAVRDELGFDSLSQAWNQGPLDGSDATPDQRAAADLRLSVLANLAKTIRETPRFPGRVVFDPTLVRGMGYYTGPIFEIGVEGLPYSIAGGGRYDRMIGKLLGRDVPACGFSIGFERVIALLLERGSRPPRAGKLLALLHEADGESGAASLAQVVDAAARLRGEGHAVSLLLKRKKVGKQLDELQKQGFDGAATLRPGGGPAQVKWFADRASAEPTL